MIKTKDAIRIARSLIGTPYNELDCINLIKKVIRTAPGGVSGYTTAGTNTLWDSINKSAKYRDLTERHEGLAGIPAGALPFKRYGEDDEGHVGIATGEGTVIHSSSKKGKVVETPLTAAEGWDCWGVHRYIETRDSGEEPQEGTMESYKAVVRLANTDSYLNVRNEPGIGGARIGKVYDGTVVTVQSMSENEWAFITYDGGSGYVDGSFLLMVNEPDSEPEPIKTTTVMNEETGETFMLVGKWKIAED